MEPEVNSPGNIIMACAVGDRCVASVSAREYGAYYIPRH